MSDPLDKVRAGQLLFGPFSENRVVVDGREIPRLTGWQEGDKTWFSVDRRFACGVL